MRMDDGDGGNSYVDSSVGTVVWVRRRNGRWWPGRVISELEVRRSRLLTNRSGTPVKLLGKEDASVDWYNFGKSRRIKAFRCGEFDDCIAKASAFVEKTREINKNARREDAIVQALEYERKQAEHSMLALGGIDRVRSGFANDGDPNDGSIFNNEAEPCGRPSEKGCSDSIPPGTVVLEKDIDSEWEDDDSSEVIPRMRDLQDFGLRMPSNKRRRADPTDACQCFPEVPLAAHENKKLDSCVIKREGSNDWHALGGVESQMRRPNLKRRKSEAASSAEETACKRRDRRKPLAQVLKCSVKLAGGDQQRDFVRPSTALDVEACMRVHESMDREAASPRQQLEAECRPEQLEKGLQPASHVVEQRTHEPLSNVDNSCAKFSGFQLPKCCDGKRMRTSSLIHFGTLDSLQVFGPASTCSFISASAHTGSFSSVNVPNFEKPGCKILANDYGLLSSKQEKMISGSESHSNPLVSHTSSLCAPSDRGFDEYSSALSKKLTDWSEASLPLAVADVKGDSIKSSRRLLQEGFLNCSDCITGEDEAESFQAVGAKRKEGLDESGSCSVVTYGPDAQMDAGRIGSKWRAKRRRNSRVPGTVRRKQGSLSRDTDTCIGTSKQGQMRSTFISGWDSRIIRASTFNGLSRESVDCGELKNGLESLPASKERVSVKSNVRNRSMKSLEELGQARYSSLYTTCQQGLCWVDVPIQTHAVHDEDGASCVSLVSKLGRPVVGCGVLVERLEWRPRASRKEARRGNCRRQCSGRRTTRRIPKRQGSQSSNLVTNMGGAYTSLMSKPKFIPRRPGSYVQKMRALSSLVFENTTKAEDKESVVRKVSEPPLVTCIPVHTIFSRIREVLFKQPPPQPWALNSSTQSASLSETMDEQRFEVREPSALS